MQASETARGFRRSAFRNCATDEEFLLKVLTSKAFWGSKELNGKTVN